MRAWRGLLTLFIPLMAVLVSVNTFAFRHGRVPGNLSFTISPPDTTPPAAAGSSSSTCDCTSLTWAHSMAAGSDRLLLVSASIFGSGQISSVTYDGQSLTRVATASYLSDVRVEMWQLFLGSSATASSASVVISLPATTKLAAGAATFSGVQTRAVLTSVTNAAKSSSPATTVNDVQQRDLVVDVLGIRGAPTLTVGAGQTQLWQVGQASNLKGAQSREAGPTTTGPVTMYWSMAANTEWAMISAVLR